LADFKPEVPRLQELSLAVGVLTSYAKKMYSMLAAGGRQHQATKDDSSG